MRDARRRSSPRRGPRGRKRWGGRAAMASRTATLRDEHAAAETPEAGQARLGHQFDHLEQQRQATTLGMWVFLVTEIMFFGGLFTAYTVYRTTYAAAFAAASHHLDIRLGGINTAILIASSFTMVMAVRAAQLSQRRGIQVAFL